LDAKAVATAGLERTYSPRLQLPLDTTTAANSGKTGETREPARLEGPEGLDVVIVVATGYSAHARAGADACRHSTHDGSSAMTGAALVAAGWTDARADITVYT
jgi:hypothetical protein